MLNSIDIERNIDENKNIQVKSNSSNESNVVSFKSQKTLESESRQKAIETIRKRSQQLHW